MKARELRDKSIEELRRTEGELREQLFKLRFQKATGQIENPVKIRMVRKDIARVQTILALRLREAE
ncbi:MAG: 50S ribosomal protein L29 [Acidobacteriota bacterium]